MPRAILIPTAITDASTPAAPLIPQNQGVGLQSMAETKRMPVGKANPIKSPAGAMTAMQTAALVKRFALSKRRSRDGNH